MVAARTANRRNLIAACAAITVFGFALGMTYPLLSLILESRGVSPDMIGINAAMMPIGILLFAPVLPVAAWRFGSRRVAIAAALLAAFLMLGYPLFDGLAAWFVLRLLQGMSISTLFVLSEAWIVTYAGDDHRGKVVAAYASILSASFGAGPAIVGIIGIDGWLPFIIGTAVLIASVLPLSLVREEHTARPRETRPSGFFGFAPRAPMLLCAVFAFAIFDAATLALLPVYGLRLGLDLPTAAGALTALIVGNVVLQFPIGWLADRLPRRGVLAGCALGAALSMALLPPTMGTAWMWLALVVGGACGYGVYTVSLSSLGDRFSGDELVSGSAAFASMWGVGALVGSTAGGWSMQGAGPHGLPIFLAVIFALLFLGLTLRAASLARANAGRSC